MGTLERRQREKEQRRKDIVDSARKFFFEKGFNGTTMPEIAKSLELSAGTLYLYFPSKESLYLELLLEGYDVMIVKLREQVRPYAAPRDQVKALTSAFFKFAEESPEYFDIIFFILQREFGGTRQSGLEQKQLKKLEEKEERCKKIVMDALSFPDSKFLGSDLRPTVEALWSMLAGVVFFWRKAGRADFGKISGQAETLIMNALFMK
ncbi:MAG: hypothetical protein A2X45_19070 [Lentisphaerae bacterium GWF2_50_93]|nr:MAG: hypothetical protein A2X45_19070 [Lentisphaerae bacterium GWF2_50_93]